MGEAGRIGDGRMEGEKQTQYEDSFNHSELEKTGDVLSPEKHTQLPVNTVGQSGIYYESTVY